MTHEIAIIELPFVLKFHSTFFEWLWTLRWLGLLDFFLFLFAVAYTYFRNDFICVWIKTSVFCSRAPVSLISRYDVSKKHFLMKYYHIFHIKPVSIYLSCYELIFLYTCLLEVSLEMFSHTTSFTYIDINI